MKILYVTQARGNVEVLSEIETSPKKLGTVGEHLAYAILTTQKYAKKTHAKNEVDLNRELKNIFTSCMNEAVTTSAMMNDLPEDFNFTIDNLAAKLVNIFVVNDASSDIVSDQRIELHIPECPIYLTQIIYGIKLNNDSNWYDIDAIYRNICLHDRQSSPMTNNIWTKVEEIRKFKVDKESDVDSDLMALYELREIKQSLRVSQQVFRGISMNNLGSYGFFTLPPAPQQNNNLSHRSNLLTDRLEMSMALITVIMLLTEVRLYAKQIRNNSDAQFFKAILPALFMRIFENLSVLERSLGSMGRYISNEELHLVNVNVSGVRSVLNSFVRNMIAEPNEELRYQQERLHR